MSITAPPQLSQQPLLASQDLRVDCVWPKEGLLHRLLDLLANAHVDCRYCLAYEL